MARGAAPHVLAGVILLVLLPHGALHGKPAAGWPAVSPPPALVGGGERDAAVVVGIQDYLHLPDIPGAVENARAWHDWLVRTRGVPIRRVHLLLDAKGADYRIREALEMAAASVERGGTLWFVFVGHGAATKDQSDGVLVGHEAPNDAMGLYQRSVPRSEILTLMGGTPSGTRRVAVIDACFSGRATGRGGEELLPGTMPVVPVSLAPVEAPETIVLSAARSDQFADALPGRKRPAFSYLLLGALRGWADQDPASGDRDGNVTAREAVDYAITALRAAGRDQEPQLDGQPADIVLTRGATETGPDLVTLSSRAGTAGPADGTSTAESGVVERGVAIDRGEDIVNEITDATGFLFIDSDPPGAQVSVNGERLGAAPVQIERMVGRYVVIAEHGRLFHPARQDLRLGTDGARVKLVLPPAFGGLFVTSSPATAEVWIDGEKVGTTPYENHQKPSGRYHVRVTADHHLPHEVDVEVRDGEIARVSASLEANHGRLVVESNPPGASIELDGNRTDTHTPHTFEFVRPGIHEVKLRLDGHGLAVERPSVVREREVRVRTQLQPKLGLLSVVSEDADGTPCQGDLLLDGEFRGTTPAKVDVLASRHQVEVRCPAGVGTSEIEVPHNGRASVVVRVAGSAAGAGVGRRPDDTARGKPIVVLETSRGTIEVELWPEKAPQTVANFLEYVDAKFYDGTIFHRVIARFMIQGGGYTQDFVEKDTRGPIQNEADNGEKNVKYTLAMARTQDPHSATAQFFINVSDNAFLDHTSKTPRGWGYAVFGKVVKGQEVVDAIAGVKTGPGGPFPKDAPQETVTIQKVYRKK